MPSIFLQQFQVAKEHLESDLVTLHLGEDAFHLLEPTLPLQVELVGFKLADDLPTFANEAMSLS